MENGASMKYPPFEITLAILSDETGIGKFVGRLSALM